MEIKEIAPGILMENLCDISSISVDLLNVELESVEDAVVHYHTDEVIYLLEGTLYGEINGEKINFEKGQVITIKKGTSHKFINKGEDTVKLLAICSPAYDEKDVHILDENKIRVHEE